MTDAPLLRAAGLWRKTSKNGRDYYVGAMGGVKVLLLENTDRDRGENDPTHYLCFAERQQRQTSAGRPQYRGDRARRPPSPAETQRAAVASQAPGPERWATEPGDTPFYDDTDGAVRDLTGGLG